MIPTNPKEYLAQHKGCKFSIAWNGNHRMKWKDSNYQSYDPRINMCQQLHDELIFEADYECKALNNMLIDLLELTFKQAGIFYLRTSHRGKSDYAWVKLSTKDNRIITEEERKELISRFGNVLGLNVRGFDEALAYYKGFVRPVPNTPHWKHNNTVEVLALHGGKSLNIDELGIIPKPKKSKPVKRNSKIEFSQGSWYDKVVSKIKLSEIAQEYLGAVQCPYCSRDDNYFVFDDDRGLFFCHDCHSKGNLVRFTELILSHASLPEKSRGLIAPVSIKEALP